MPKHNTTIGITRAGVGLRYLFGLILVLILAILFVDIRDPP